MIEHKIADAINDHLENNPEDTKVTFKVHQIVDLSEIITNVKKCYYVQQMGDLIVGHVRSK